MTLAALPARFISTGWPIPPTLLAAGNDRDRALAIMRDSQIGSFGAIALFFVLALKLLALTSACGGRMLALYLAPVSTLAMVAIADRLDYLPARVRARHCWRCQVPRFVRRISDRHVAVLPVLGHRALCAVVTAVVLSLLLRVIIGDGWRITGDMLGAAGELVETAVLIAVTR